MNRTASFQSQYHQDYHAAQDYYGQPFQYGVYGGEPALTVHDFTSYAAHAAPADTQGSNPNKQYFEGRPDAAPDNYLEEERRR